MVSVAQLVEHRIVAPDAAGSRPVIHPILIQGLRVKLANLFLLFQRLSLKLYLKCMLV